MWELDQKEGWVPKNWCFWTVVLEKTLESPLACKEIQPVHPKGDQSWIFIGRTDAETEAPIPWPPDVKSQLIRKDPDAGKYWKQVEKGMTEDETVGWHHRLHGHKFEKAPGDGEGQGSLACCSPWGHKESQTIERLNNKLTFIIGWMVTSQKTWPLPDPHSLWMWPHLDKVSLLMTSVFIRHIQGTDTEKREGHVKEAEVGVM